MDVNTSGEPWRGDYRHDCAWELDLPPMSLVDMFVASAAAHADAPLIQFEGRSFSYAALLEEARRFAAGLRAAGIVHGDRVGLFLPNVPTYVPAYFGALMAGATVVNFSPLYTPQELEAQVLDSGTRLLVTLDVPALLPTAIEVLRNSRLQRLAVVHLADLLPPVVGSLLRLFGRSRLAKIPRASDICSWQSLLGEAAGDHDGVDPETELALLQYTGGTTGTPKGAMLTHQNLTANARQLRAIDPNRDERDVVLGVLPLFHVFANTCVLNRTIANGGCVVMQARFEPQQVLKAVTRSQPTSIFVVPTMLQALLDHPDFQATDFSSLRGVISGGAPLPLPVKQRFEAESGVKVIEGYGLTEGSGVITTNPLEGENRAGTIGQPLPQTRLRLLDKEDPAKDAEPGEPGELAVLGPQVMQGYWHRPEDAANAFAMRDGERWLRTGDIAVFDPDGYVRIVDRSKDMIAVAGFKVFPSQVEAVLLQHPAVREAIVIGIAEDYHGEMPRAYVTLRPDRSAAEDELRDWLNSRIGKHERVDAVVIRVDLPKTVIGKLDRKALRAEVGAS